MRYYINHILVNTSSDGIPKDVHTVARQMFEGKLDMLPLVYTVDDP